MRRKLVEQGGTTLMVSLPSKWARQFKLSKGDEVEVLEQGNGLYIGIDKEVKQENTHLNISGMKPLIKRALGAVYKKGYDSVDVEFDSPEELQIAQEVINQEFVGFEIITLGKKNFTAKRISSIEHSEFDAALKRVFMFLFSVGDDTIESMKNKDTQAARSIALRDVSINKLCDFCRRSLNKRGFADPTKTNMVYFIVEQLEKIGDVYKNMNDYVAENSLKPGKDIIDCLGKLDSYVRMFYDVFYKFNMQAMLEFHSRNLAVEKELEKAQDKVQKHELKLVFYMELLKNLVFDMNGAVMAMNL